MRARNTIVLLAATTALACVTQAAASGRICTSRDTVQFGNVGVGSAVSASAVVSNCGDSAFTFTDVSTDAATGPAFHVSTTCATGSVLAPGNTCNVAIQFAPLVDGQTSGALWLRTNTSTPDQFISFYGRGVNADSGSATLAFVPASATFPAQRVGTQSEPLTLELQNRGPVALTLSAVVLNGPSVYDFSGFDDNCAPGNTIAAGASCHMRLYFAPHSVGNSLANLVIDSPQLSSLAILQISGHAVAPSATVDVIEYYNIAMDHYFISSLQPDIDALDSGRIPGWTRTGLSFKAYPQAIQGASAVCRFYIPPAQGDSHFYSASVAECAATATRFPSFVEESTAVMYVDLPDATTSVCPGSDVPVFRLWNRRVDSNHRYTTDAAVRTQMTDKGWIAEGYGPNQVIMCAPP